MKKYFIIINNIEDYFNYKGELLTIVAYHSDMETCTVENSKGRLWWGYISDLLEIELEGKQENNIKILTETL